MEKQTAVEWLLNEISVILGPLKTKPMQGLLIIDAINKAKEKEKEQHGQTWDSALKAGEDRAWNVMRAYSDFDDYYEKTYENK
jgi:Ribonuclease G/E